MQEIVHVVKPPSGIATTVQMSLSILILANSGISLMEGRGDGVRLVLFYLIQTSLLMCMVVLVMTLIREGRKPTRLILGTQTLKVNGRVIEPGEVVMIMKKGYFRAIIGVKPHGRRIVPMDMCFRFVREEDQGLSDLQRWAERNGVPMEDRPFLTWL